ncbi:DUF2316 family protein [Allobranchiibius sp. CTAmp26]|uniref:DUF2316 family protein n=1 Tax=Allobranchiibius sp. CTAmp26 TaxID=2815214 RepID=UPI001AA1AB6C|nr:DUF2316 family protein [Allobranchiibius sp. CTAmp26]MBO1754394.1 DUF2316 family protein [Allobranchiibius sp. CTAmp26]
MSLDAAETARTRRELRANFELSGLTTAEVAADLVLDPGALERLLDLSGRTDPADVWCLRDYLEQAVLDQGRTPVPFSVLDEPGRMRARTWFLLRPAPHHRFTS